MKAKRKMRNTMILLMPALIIGVAISFGSKLLNGLGNATLVLAGSQVPAGGMSTLFDELEGKCFVCDKVEDTIERYIDTVFYMYKHDKDFVDKLKSCKGFCTSHYGLLMKRASGKLSGAQYTEFTELITKLYIDNMKRVRDDVAWFINKFDHKYANEPWKNAKDSLVRATFKDTGVNIQ